MQEKIRSLSSFSTFCILARPRVPAILREEIGAGKLEKQLRDACVSPGITNLSKFVLYKKISSITKILEVVAGWRGDTKPTVSEWGTKIQRVTESKTGSFSFPLPLPRIHAVMVKCQKSMY